MYIRKQSLKACCWFSIFDVGTIWYKTIRIGQVEMIKKTFKSWIKVFRCVGGGGVSSFSVGESWKQGSNKLAKGGDTFIMSPVKINSYKLVYFSYF